ncbi:ESPR domain-containing protein [Acidithiobacillus ferrivorans]|uniref:ESPR domain-containing protein n=1 Tax=Acidithiobacillus ferrivorans TaxID=160808 RepID=UPI003AA7D55E
MTTNRFYRLVWNHALGVLQVASELTKTASGGAAGKTSPGSTAGNTTPRRLCRSAEAAGFGDVSTFGMGERNSGKNSTIITCYHKRLINTLTRFNNSDDKHK